MSKVAKKRSRLLRYRIFKLAKKTFSKNKSYVAVLGALFLIAGGITLAQGLGYFPRYPYRISSIAKELALAGEDLAYLNQELKKQVDECSCGNTKSQCGQGSYASGAAQNIEMNPFKFDPSKAPGAAIDEALNQLDYTKNQIKNSVNGLNAFIFTSKQPSLQKTTTYGVEIKGDDPEEEAERAVEGTEQDLKSELKLTAQEIKQIEDRLTNLKALDKSITNQQNDLSKLKGDLNKYSSEELENALNQAQNNLNQQLSKITNFPQQLQDKLVNIADQMMAKLENYAEDIKNALKPTQCQVGSTKILGSACKNEKFIEQTEMEIADKSDQVIYLKRLLEAEIKSGLDDELKTLRPEDAEKLKADLTNLIGYTEKIVSSSDKNIGVVENYDYSAQKQCSPNCDQGMGVGLQACLSKGEQGKIKLKYKVGIELEDLDLGSIGIKKAELNLPDKIEFEGIDKIKEFRIPMPDAVIDYPDLSKEKKTFSMKPIVVHPPSFNLPTFPLGDFSCPKITTNSYSCPPAGEDPPLSYINLQWYLQTFSYLSERCQEIPELNDEDGLPDQEHIKKCMDKDNVQTYIVQQCDALWKQYLACLITKPLGSECGLPTGICKDIKRPSQRDKAINEQCLEFFSQIKATPPAACGLKELQGACDAARKEGIEDAFEPCMYAPVFTGKMEKPEKEEFGYDPEYCSGQNVTDVSGIGIRAECPLPYSGQADIAPKLKLPEIKIPDIKLPDFNFSPFIKVNLPSFIFEDLKFETMAFCNYKDCLNILPPVSLNIPYPTLRIPSIDIGSRRIKVPTGLGMGDMDLDLDIDKIDFPPIPIPIPSIDLMKLLSLEYEMPKIPIPQPKMVLDFMGLDIDPFNILLGLVASALDIPSGCIGGGINFIPLVISYPDYYFYWPRFPEMPDLCNNKYISVNNFCGKIKDAISPEITSRIAEIQKTINRAQSAIQKPLDQISDLMENIVKKEINDRLDKMEDKIRSQAKDEIQKLLRQAQAACDADEDCKNANEKISELSKPAIPLGDIVISEEKLKPINDILSKIPTEIPLKWSKEIERIDLCKKNGKEKCAYPLPPIPLNNMGYTKTKEIPLPGLQKNSFSLSISGLGSSASCAGNTPSRGNPYPTGEIQGNTNAIKNINEEIQKSMEGIVDILE